MPDLLANKIAAGEVVERPASVVKELLENSVDAGSSSIKIEVEEAGLKQIKITDNGSGIEAEDVETAFLRHATSKIRNENDLFHVRTLGFRGEALASIAAVSQLTVKTSTGTEAGTILKLEAGKIVDRSKGDARKGTEIIVKGLFYNTPARLKYMKTIHTELGHITEVVNRMALSHADIRFELYHNGKNIFRTNGSGDLIQIIAQVYGVNIAKKMIPVSHQTLDYTITGYIAKPEVTRASRHYISTIINGRFVRSIPLNKAVLSGYHTLLPIGRNPIVVLDIKMDPILVDVNVHPAKLEVRFSKEKELFEAIETLIKQAFRKETLIPEINQPKKAKQESTQHAFTFDQKGPVDKVKKDDDLPPRFDQSQPSYDLIYETEDINTSRIDHEQTALDTNYQDDNTDNDQDSHTSASRIPVMYPIGQHHGTYIIAENEEGLYMVDQHAAQERIKYEYFRDKIGDVANEVQELLFPLTFDFSNQEALVVAQYQEELKQVGVFFEHFGQQTYIVRSHPQWFPKGFEEEIIREIVEQVMTEEKIDIAKLREEAAILMSCKQSIKANHYLNKEDMAQLLDDLRKSTDPFTCPHGRPIIIHFSGYEIEKMFKRVM